MNEHATLPEVPCQAGHVEHDTRLVEISLRGPTRVPDYPAIPDRLSREFRMRVYERDRYIDYPAYCTGKDELSHSILTHGVWEGFETLVALDAIYEGNPARETVLDFGGHLGWYSLLAGTAGFPVRAFEADAENVRNFRKNMGANAAAHLVSVDHAWIDEGFRLDPSVQDVAFMKCDIEGKEPYAVAACADLFGRRKIRYALIEMSPVFPTDGTRSPYVQIAQQIADCGYDIADIPSKGFAHMRELEADPIGTIRRRCRVERDDVERYLRGVAQTNFFFSRW